MASMISVPSLPRVRPTPRRRPPPILENGDRLSQPEFHRRYEQMAEDVKAELIGGVVYMASPLRAPHGGGSRLIASVLGTYQAATPGVDGEDNATTILGEQSEPQPDHLLRLSPERGGRSRVNKEQYLVGPPELVIEIAHSTAAIDLHAKKEDYRDAGVMEYVVVCLEEERKVRAFDLPKGQPWPIPEDGIWRSRVFPGLWIDTKALLANDAARLLRTARKGLASAEQKAFVRAFKGRAAKGQVKRKR